jgi:hypothetical protein
MNIPNLNNQYQCDGEHSQMTTSESKLSTIYIERSYSVSLLIIILLQRVYRQHFTKGHTGSMTLPTILSILMERHKNPSPTSLTRTLPPQPLNLPIRINRIIFQRSKFFPAINIAPKPPEPNQGKGERTSYAYV